MFKSVLITTTSTIEGWEIQKYIKPVSAHIVAGTDFFSDFAASFTDFLGGRSSNYQYQITTIYNEAIKQLQQAAIELGANCIIGLSIDMDEISGKGKSMFMVTAIGTAVKAKSKQQDFKIEALKREEVLSSDRLSLMRRKKSILDEAENNQLLLTEERWNFIIENQVYELFPYILDKWAVFSQTNTTEENNSFRSKLFNLLYPLPDELKIELIYDAILNEKYIRLISGLSFILRDLQLWNIDLIKQGLNSEDFLKQKKSLILTIYDKPFYDYSDLSEIEELMEIIQSNFKEKGQRTTKKQLLSAKEKEVWNCPCGKQNISDEYCPTCNQDIYGFKTNEIKPEKAITILSDKKELLIQHYN